MKYYAKTYYENGKKKAETIQEHTEELIDALRELKSIYSNEISEIYTKNDIWKDLEIACIFHDLGKASISFQNNIRSFLKLSKLDSQTGNISEIPHNYLSPAFLEGLSGLTKGQKLRILFAIAFHHDRSFDFNEDELIKSIENNISNIDNEILEWIKEYYYDYNYSSINANYYHRLKTYLDENNNKINEIKYSNDFVILKGLLHRLDYSASAHVPIETERLGDTTKPLINYLFRKHKSNSLKEFQKKGEYYRNKSVIATASTGIGKTEFAVNWLGDNKSFYTLPLRVSSNAMHKRLSDIFGIEKVGLLHSDSFSYEIENNKEQSVETNINKINITRQLSFPLTVTTADQLFTSVFKWPGYERIYATLAYSKIILDEPQGYSPKTLAMIIKSLEEINQLGGSFCYMSATNHPFIIEKMKNIAYILPYEFNQKKKHKIELVPGIVNELIERIINAYKDSNNKILVIVNTVKKSQEIYSILSEELNNVKLLHSGFIKSDRNLKEDDIKIDFKKTVPVVWVTTQLVEASLDIDYDILFTEKASIDSLVQRMGRVYRASYKEIRKDNSPNIIISCGDPSDNYYIYDKIIVDRTVEKLKEFHIKILTDKSKQDLMNSVYNEKEIKETGFYKEFNYAYSLLELGYKADNKKEAQRMFREISQVNGIPTPIYDKNQIRIDELIKVIKNTKTKLSDRLMANHELNQFTLSIPIWKKGGSSELIKSKDITKSIFLIPSNYNSYIGMDIKGMENIF